MSEQMIKETVERLFSKEVHRALLENAEAGEFPTSLWQTVVDTGLTKTLCKEEHGGIEASWHDALPLFFQIGYAQAPVPLPGSVIGQFFASRNGLDIDADKVFAIIAGTQAKALIVSQGSQDNAPTLSGVAKAVKWARNADFLLVESAQCRFLVNPKSPGVAIEHGKDTASLPSDTVTFDNVTVEHVLTNGIEELAAATHVIQAAVTSAMLTGALEFSLNLAVQYVKDRVQFGKPIGKNQAIQQQLAILAGEVSSSYAATTTALRDLPGINDVAAPHALFSTAVAKITTSDAVKTGASIAHQVHGAIGFTYEYSLNFATRRLWAWRTEAGSSGDWADLLGKAFINAGSSSFWEHLTARTLPQQGATAHA